VSDSSSEGRGPRVRGFVMAALVVALAAAIAACAGTSPPPGAATSGSIPPVVRAVLAAGDPANADGQKLELVRYTIQPGTKLPAHNHPGMQLAFIESGTLTYTVIEGTVTVTGVDGAPRTVGPGQTATVVAGEWLIESQEIVHFGENAATVPVVILAASLLEAGQPAAIPESPSPAIEASPVQPGFESPAPSS
jgi:quercetin dioxygenase-like cupin family protein